MSISIITPIYCDISQKIDWLDEMIQSVISQTVMDWEIILIDDKSPLSLNIIKMKYENDPRLRWFENAENSGPAKTRNTAVGLAINDCILPLDSDDMLASSEVLEKMYDVWLVNPSVIVYGNLQMYTPVDNSGRFQKGKVIELGQYTFELAMNLEGLMPVTAMHSKECHIQTICDSDICLDNNRKPINGWKAYLTEGLEDVEYWIAAGKHGFCGKKINITTLIYRQQEGSRAYKLKHDKDPKFRVMQNKIKQMHSDIYVGRFPVACCGKQANISADDPVIMSNQVRQSGGIKYITELSGYDEKNLEWVLYDGMKKASIGSVLTHGGPNLPNEYPIMGKGHIFQIHKTHHKIFSDRQRLGFKMNQPDPRIKEPEPEPEIQIEALQITEIPKPEMSTIVRLDAIATGTVEANIQSMPDDYIEEVIIEPNPPPFISDTMSGGYPLPSESFSLPSLEEAKPQADLHISNLGLSEKLTALLDENGWNVELAAIARPEQFIMLSGIGVKRAENIIAKAKELLK